MKQYQASIKKLVLDVCLCDHNSVPGAASYILLLR